MKVECTKYTQTKPKSQVTYSHWSIDLGGGIFTLLHAVGRVIAKHFGLLYVPAIEVQLHKGDEDSSDPYRIIAAYPPDANVWIHSEPKPTGGTRTIISPNASLNNWLRTVNEAFNKRFRRWPALMHGGIKGRSYITFAAPHVGKPCVITMDIQRCFDSISERTVAKTLATNLNVPEYEAVAIAKQICHRRAIAQGYPTSNFVCNLVLKTPLLRIEKRLAEQGLIITNYVDDIAISGSIDNPSDVINLVATELSRIGLAVKKAKTKVMPHTKRQVICGLVVNRRLSLTKQKKLQICRAVSSRSIFEESLRGLLAHLHAVDEKFEAKLRRYALTKGYTV